MGMSTGCTKEADTAFAAKHVVIITTNHRENKVALTKEDSTVLLSSVYGDCTAATIYTGDINTNKLIEFIPIIREYLSLNARINCFGSRLFKNEQEAQDFIKALVNNNVLVSHVTQGNRNNNIHERMVSYNICTTSPIVSGYANGKAEHVHNLTHNHFDVEKFKAFRREFGLYLKQGKAL